ncbi:hypothetical protein [uncultured Methylibium sp.]|uniref:hypothetical protein n=1 Tax=uncultured Methylibium sp. TaxID=381093 RepID=UPI0025FF2134|nr:hypothetical protein [uncultured Methylibium sp.]
MNHHPHRLVAVALATALVGAAVVSWAGPNLDSPADLAWLSAHALPANPPIVRSTT